MISEYKSQINPVFLSVIPIMTSSEQDGIILSENGASSEYGYRLFDDDSATYYEPPIGAALNKRFKITVPEQKTVIGISFKLAEGASLKNFYFMDNSNNTIGYYDFRDKPLTFEDGLIVLNAEFVFSSNEFTLNIPAEGVIASETYGDKIRFSEFQIYVNKPPQGAQRVTPRQLRSSTINYKDFEQQMGGMPVPYFEEFLPDEGQTKIILGTNYVKGNGGLQVILNGQVLTPGVDGDYTEVDGKSIVFNQPLYSGDWVVTRIEGAGGGVTLENTIHRGERPNEPIDGVNKVFTLQYLPERKSEQVYMNGMLMSEGFDEDYQISGKTITFEYPPAIGSKLRICYRPIVSQFI